MKTLKLSAERARELLHYDPETGSLAWKISPSKKVRAGAVAGSIVDGYVAVGIDKVLHKGHRVAWLISNGSWPRGFIDHIDGVRSNNRLANLREATPLLNQQNHRRAQSNSSTGVMGVFPKGERFLTRIKVFGKAKHLGVYDTPEEAHQAYLTAKRQLHAGCTI